MRIAAAVVVLAACRSHAAQRPLAEAIVGTWEELCKTDAETKSTCLGKTDHGVAHTFKPDGSVELAVLGRGDAPLVGTWTLRDHDLELAFDGGGVALAERYRARIKDDALVLWDTSQGFGTVYGRLGAAFSREASATTDGSPVAAAIDDVHFTLALPAGYRLARDDHHRQTWQPASGAGFEVRLTLGPRAHELANGVPIMAPCPTAPPGVSGVSGGKQTIAGVERDTDVGIDRCLGPDSILMCSAGHTRGYLEPAEKPAALALCQSLTIAAQAPAAR